MADDVTVHGAVVREECFPGHRIELADTSAAWLGKDEDAGG